MLKWNSDKRRRITIGQSFCRDGSRGARCHAIRYDTMVWSRLCGVSDMRDKQGVPCNNVPHQSQLISTTDDGILVLVRSLFFALSAAVPGEDQSVGDAEPRAARISVGSLFYYRSIYLITILCRTIFIWLFLHSKRHTANYRTRYSIVRNYFPRFFYFLPASQERLTVVGGFAKSQAQSNKRGSPVRG